MKKKILSIVLSVSITIGTGATFAQSKVDLEYIDGMAQFIDQNYLYDVEGKQLTDGAIKGLFYNLDPYSNYYTDLEYKMLEENMAVQSKTSGIGIKIIQVEGSLKIIELLKGHGAESAGLRVSDIIVSVDDKDISGLAVESVSALVRGATNSTVKIGVIREDQEEVMVFDVIRTPIVYNTIESKVIDGMGYIKINEFNKGSFVKIEKILKDFKAQNINRLIFDVRDNPGGFLTDTINTLGLIVPEGPILHVKNKKGNQETFYSFNKKADNKMVVLTSKNSASAAEVFAGAIKDRNAGTIIGEKTFGKGTVQNIIPLERGGAVKLTIAEYFTPNNTKVNKIGITPHIILEPSSDSKGNDLVLKRAIEELKK